MRYVTLETVSDEYDNKPGFALADAKRYEGFMADRGEFFALGHDIVEHQNGLAAIGPIWDELQAVGGIWHARGRWGDLMMDSGSMYSVVENVASDIVRMARDLSFMGWHDSEAMGRCPNTRPHDHDEDFLEILDIARRQIPGELEDDQPLDIERYLGEALHHMRTGFRKATRRFGDGFGSNNQLQAIRDAVKRAARDIEFEGQRFRLAWGNGECTISEIWETE